MASSTSVESGDIDTTSNQNVEFQVQKYIDESLVMNRDCNILQCYMNDYTDCLKVSYKHVPSNNCIVYRINTVQTNPSVKNTTTGHCGVIEFKTLVQDTIINFTNSINNKKIHNNWDVSIVYADESKKRQDIMQREGDTLEGFINIIDEITNIVSDNVMSCVV